jgi:hypothetical protein
VNGQKRGHQNQQVARAGELFVAAELNKRGAMATLYLTSTPRVDVVATDSNQHNSVSIQVKTKSPRSKVWQANIEKLRLESEKAGESDFLILVDLGTDKEAPTYFICPLQQVAAEQLQKHEAWLLGHGGRRPRGSDSPHTSITVDDVTKWRDRWDLLHILPPGQGREADV